MKFEYEDKIPQGITSAKKLKPYIEPEYVMEYLMKDIDEYYRFQNHMYNIIKGCFEIKECRSYPIKFRFNNSDTKVHTLPFQEFILNVFIWSPLCLITVPNFMDESYIMDFPHLTGKSYADYMNKMLVGSLRAYNVPVQDMNRGMADVIGNLGIIPNDFALIIGSSLSLQPFLDAYDQSPRMKEIMTTQYPETMQPAEIEAANEDLMHETIDLFKSMEDNEVGKILYIGKGIKNKQLREFVANVGPKPTIDGKTIAKPVNSNNLITGLQSPSEHFIEALGARKSFVMNNSKMGPAGYFGKTVLILARTVGLSRTVSDCDTKHGVRVTVESKKWLDKLHDRWYRMSEDDKYHLINAEKDTFLIGKEIILRSPITCSLGDGCVCAKCFGRNAILNYDISAGLGAFGCEEISKVLNQNILSVKHLLTTISNLIKFNDAFYKYFEILGSDIFIKEGAGLIKEDGSEEYAIYIDKNNFSNIDELDGDFMFNTVHKGPFYVVNRKTGESTEILCTTAEELFPTEKCIQLVKQNNGYIDFSELGSDSLFYVDIENNELTKPLYNIMALIKQSSNAASETIDSMTQKFISYLIEGSIDATAVECEMIIHCLVRSVENPYDRPDFSKSTLEPYTLFSVSQALLKNRSPLLGLSFEKVKSQMSSYELYYERHGTSYIDALWEPVVNVDKFMNYKKITPEMAHHNK